ncbi:MAG: hypothetical protein WBG01_08750 [Bacteroidota bacterium]
MNMNAHEKLQQTKEYLKGNYDLHRNIISDQVEFKAKGTGQYLKLDKSSLETLKSELEANCIRISRGMLSCLLNSDSLPDFDPIMEYYHTLPQWGGNPNFIANLAGTAGMKNPEPLKEWFLNMVGCSLEESVNEECLVLHGANQQDQIRWLMRLIPPSLHHYLYVGPVGLTDRKIDHLMTEKQLIVATDLESLTGQQRSRFIGDLTMKDAEIRSGKRQPETRERRASVVGSICSDGAVARFDRYWRIRVLEVDRVEPYHTVDIDLAYSQVYALWTAQAMGFVQQNTERN